MRRLKDWWREIPLGGIGRSSQWSKLRNEYIKRHPFCAVCNGKKKLEVHHVIPFNVDPSKEHDDLNLLTLCEKNKCHIMFGHLGSYFSFNLSVREDAAVMNNKIFNRPKSGQSV